MERIRENRIWILVTTLVLLLPVAAGLILWNKLPERIAVNWSAAGAANEWKGRGFAVFALPGVFLGAHLICIAAMALDPRRKGIDNKVFRLILLLCPALSLVCAAVVYLNALEVRVSVPTVCGILLGAIVLAAGNYLPKCRRNYTVGIRLPWIMEDDDLWNRTHRFTGRVWIALGVLMIVCAAAGLGMAWSVGVLLGIAVIAPLAYSLVIAAKRK